MFNNQNTKFIVYGNISDIDYLKECLNIGAISYAIRPLKPSDLKKCLNAALEYFKSFEILKTEEKMLDMEYLQNFKVFESKFLSVLINEVVFDKEEIENSFDYFNINITKPYRTCVIRIDSFRKHILSKTQKEKHILIFKIFKIVENNLKDAKAFINLFNEIVVILGGETNLEDVIKILTDIKLTIKEHTDINVSCGIGRKYENANNIRTSFVEANTALKYRCIVGYNSVIPIHYVEPNNIFSARYPYEKEKALVYTAVIGEYEYCLKLLNQIYEEIRNFKDRFEKILPQVTFSTILSIYRLAFEQGLEIQHISNFFDTKEILNLKDIEKSYEFLKNGIEKFCAYIKEFRENEKTIIENITYKSLATKLNCNSKYFKEIFDTNSQMNLLDYIEKFRINKAKEMILETTLSDDIIALKLGYSDVATFRKNFKKFEGALVGDFRLINKDLKRR